MTDVLPLLTVLAVDAIVLVALVVPTLVKTAITVATASTGKGKGICRIETVKPEMGGTEGDAAGPLTKGAALRLSTEGGSMIGTGVRGPLPWRMSKKILMIATGRGPPLRPPLMTIEHWTVLPARWLLTLVRIQSLFFERCTIRFLVVRVATLLCASVYVV